MTPSLAALQERLPALMPLDQRKLGRRIDRAAALRDAAARQRALAGVETGLAAALARVEARSQSVPAITYPAELPVSQRKDEIAAAIRDHQVVIVAGETGSGKTTQLPKICLELGRGIAGQIGHTQPRRIAARTVADRIAAELGTELGGVVGYKVRFAGTSSDDTLVKVMTDGILLTELQRDRELLRYDTLIIDEAHERSLNIDFILGYLKRLLPSRPDLKVIITSATIDPQRFSTQFWGAPVIEVSGRTYPVEVRYRPLADPDHPDREPRDQVQGISDAVAELTAEGPGDILVFLSGEREIRDTAEALAGRPNLDVLPLYARLPAAEQHRIFDPHQARRVVLATNIAETSLTVPGVRYVIDAGTARISRYGQRAKVQRLPIERISQASADQRKGRCGRTADGICIRLYSEEDFASRPQFTDPEILRTSLAAVILQMAALGLGEIGDFPFIDPPQSRNVTDGVRLLEELGALTPGRGPSRLTDVGRKLARLPLDPRLGRMILEAGRQGCVSEVLIITAALSIQDPRERPAEAREAADAMHARFAEPGSDFLALLTLWDYLRDRQRELSGSAFRRLCRREYLHYLRVREWQDVHGQLRQAARDIGVAAGPGRAAPAPEEEQPRRRKKKAPNGHARDTAAGRTRRGEDKPEGRVPAEIADRVHISLLSGLLSHIGMQDTRRPEGKRRGPAEFAAARGARFALFPDSSLARKPPQWVMAAELVETSRLWARTAAAIKPEWAESLAAHLVKRGYSEPRWDAKRGAAMATEKVTLYGLPIVAARPVGYGTIDPAAARELFIQHALVEGDWQTHHRFFHHNRELLDEAADLERRARRRGIVVDDAALFDFYDRRIPGDVTSARHFDAWWKKARVSEPGLLTFSAGDLVGPAAGEIRPVDYPDAWDELPLSYEFAPGEPEDGVTTDVPLALLNQVSGDELGLAGSRAAGGTGDRADPVAAQAAAHRLRARPRHRPRRGGPAGTRARRPAGRARRRARPHWRGEDPARRVGPVPAARAPEDDVPRARRRPGARQRQGSGRPAAATAAPARGGAVRCGQRDHPHRAHRLDVRHLAQGLPARPGPCLPGAGRRREHGGRPAVPDRSRGQRRDAPRHPPAAAAPGALGRPVHRRPAAAAGQARPEFAPVPERECPARRLRGLRGRCGDRRIRRPGLGRRGLRAAGRCGAVLAGRHHGRGGRGRRARPRGGARGPDQAGAGRRPGGGARRHARPVLRAGLLRVHRRDRAGPAARPGPLPQGHHPQAGQDARVSRARRGADGGRAPGHGRLRAGPGRAWRARPGPAPPRPLSAG